VRRVGLDDVFLVHEGALAKLGVVLVVEGRGLPQQVLQMLDNFLESVGKLTRQWRL
jgi:hypothetical protein